MTLPEMLPLASAAYLTLDNAALRLDLLRTQRALLEAQMRLVQQDAERERAYLMEAHGLPRVAACRYAYDAPARALRLVPLAPQPDGETEDTPRV